MAQRSLQLAAGLLLLVGLLGLSTALIAEVREEVTHRSDEADRDPAREAQDPRSGLPVPELTLLDPTEARIPDRERTDDGLQATGPGHLRLDPGEGIRPGSLTLGADTTLVLGDRWALEEGEVTCTTPCRLDTAEAELDLPPNASLHPPASAGAIGTATVLQPGASIGVPTETELQLPPVRFPSGTRLDLEPGAHAELPGAAQQWAPLSTTEVLQLPAGTVLTRSAAAGDDLEALAEMLDRSHQQTPDGDLAPQRPTIEVTNTPRHIEKGEPFAVSGHVVGPEGGRLADHPVTVYANASKHAPGLEIQLEATKTGPAGTYTATAVLPETAPTRPYHILAHAHARPDHQPPLAGAWSDPVVPVRGEAEIALDLPDRAGADVPLPLEADLLDAYGAPIPNQTVLFEIANTDHRLTARTGLEGQAHAILPQGLPFTGNYTIHASFPGTDNVTADEDEATLEIVEARIQADAQHRTPRGEPTEIEGRVVVEDGDPGRVKVVASYADVTADADTDPHGQFTLELPVPADLAPGNHTVDVRADAVDAQHRLVLTATAGLEIETPRPGPQPIGAHAPIPVDVRADNGTPMPGIRLTAHLDDRVAGRAITDSSGHVQLSVPIPRSGEHRVRVEAEPPPAYRSAVRNLTFSAGPLEIESDLGVAPGRPTNGTLRLSVDDQPLTGTRLQLVAPGMISRATTDDDGRARLQLQAPSEAEPGLYAANLSLPAYRFDTNAPVRVLETPDLAVQVLDQGQDGQPVRLTVTAEGRDGPLSGVPLIVRAHGAFEARDQAVTGADGTANLTLPRPDDAEGSVEIDVLARSTPETARTLQTTSAEVTASPVPWAWLLAGAAALGVAGAAAVRHRRREPATFEAEHHGPTISLRLAEQRPGDPPVWHPGEGTELFIELTDPNDEPMPGAIHLEGPAGTRELSLDEQGQARMALPAHSLGTYTYRARFEGDVEHPASEASIELRIADYREEIDRAYRQLRQAATRAGLVGPDATPRELATALGEPADQLARLFERYDYSPRTVDRSDYERFMQLRREADPRE